MKVRDFDPDCLYANSHDHIIVCGECKGGYPLKDEATPSKEVSKWADQAMFAAEPLVAAEGPRVYLLEMSSDPLGQIAAACKMYKGQVVRNLDEVTDDERREYFEQVRRTKLKAPYEFVKFHFLIEGVTRSLTHQMVRQRTAVYAQESLRFAVKENLAAGVALPPSIAGTTGDTPIYGAEYYLLSDAEKMRAKWDSAVEVVNDVYTSLVNSGMPAEDARGLLPHNITTRLHYSTDLRALQDHAGNRLTTQAQFEWRLLWARIVEAIRDYRPMAWTGDDIGWQYELLSTLFKPVCYITGKCEFMANFDRPCSIRDRVEAFHKAGIDPAYWETGTEEERAGVSPIRPAEWLADPSAAR